MTLPNGIRPSLVGRYTTAPARRGLKASYGAEGGTEGSSCRLGASGSNDPNLGEIGDIKVKSPKNKQGYSLAFLPFFFGK